MGDFYNRGGGSLVLTDLEVDGTTVVVDETNDRVGIGTDSPQVQLEIHDTTTSSANTGGALRLSANDGAVMGDSHRLGVIEFTGAEDTSNTQTVGARIEAITEAAWTNAENGCALYFYTTDGNASQSNVFKLDSDKRASFTGKVGIGDSVPGTPLQITDTAPYVTLKNSTSENTAGGCESKIIFEDHGDNALGQIEVSHVGTGDDAKGQLILSTNSNSGVVTAVTISEAQVTTFAANVVVGGTTPKITIGDAGTEDTMLAFDGNAVDFRIGIDDGTDTLEIGKGTAHGTTPSIKIDSATNLQLMHNSAVADGEYSGDLAMFTAGEDLTAGEVVYFKSDGKCWKSVATAAATSRCVAMAMETTSADAMGPFLLKGFARFNSEFPTYTVGGVLYTPEAETSGKNVPEQAAPDTDGDFVQVIGWAPTADSVYFDPDSTVVEVA